MGDQKEKSYLMKKKRKLQSGIRHSAKDPGSTTECLKIQIRNSVILADGILTRIGMLEFSRGEPRGNVRFSAHPAGGRRDGA